MSIEPVPLSAFREAMSHFPSGVTVVAAQGPGGPVGFTATGFTSVSLNPPLVLVCVGSTASAHDGVVRAVRFGISILAESQKSVAEQFARSGADRFRGVPLRRADVPLVDGALVQLECRKHAQHVAGDHTILVGEVVAAAVGAGRPLVHFARAFGGFVAESAGRSAPRSTLCRARPGEEA